MWAQRLLGPSELWPQQVLHTLSCNRVTLAAELSMD